jgi:hypothetical protein
MTRLFSAAGMFVLGIAHHRLRNESVAADSSIDLEKLRTARRCKARQFRACGFPSGLIPSSSQLKSASS